ncbi:glycosyltransferase [Algoriphagus sp. PAP.12]|uniref:glycosyltransferase n=1 Tax=Algoriphagus sp. PAP.12 TaxID=2996678 RepID=UPI00227C9341|nr:glycosyltransferase [Algoriphagus sp. PAP.12]
MSCSIILCTYNGAKKLHTTLDAIIHQDSNYPWELIVIDNNSSDNTYAEAKAILKDSGIDFRIEKFSKPGKMYAFWFGIGLAKYDIILDCDDDNELFKDYLDIGLSILQSNLKLGALGGCGILPEQNLPIWFPKFAKSYALGPQGINLEPLPKFAHLYGAGCFYRRPILNNLKNRGFESLLSCRKGEELSSGGDVEFCHAIQLEGFDLMYSESLKFYHHIDKHRIDFEYYLRLKRGISNSFPILSAYRLDEFQNRSDFRKHLFYSFFIILKGIIKTSLISKNSFQSEVDYVVVRTKFWAFIRNYREAMNGYNRNQKIFGN